MNNENIMNAQAQSKACTNNEDYTPISIEQRRFNLINRVMSLVKEQNLKVIVLSEEDYIRQVAETLTKISHEYTSTPNPFYVNKSWDLPTWVKAINAYGEYLTKYKEYWRDKGAKAIESGSIAEELEAAFVLSNYFL